MRKFYIFRVHNGMKEYKRTKCLNHWHKDKSICWKFSEGGAKRIIKTLNEYKRTDYYSYGMELIII